MLSRIKEYLRQNNLFSTSMEIVIVVVLAAFTFICLYAAHMS
jgi:hypothetical protein